MKKSSLLAVALASLVGLVGCKQQPKPAPKKTDSQEVTEEAFAVFYDEVSYGGDFELDADTQGKYWNFETNDPNSYYKVPEFEDSYVFIAPIIPLYATEDEGIYVIHFSESGDYVQPLSVMAQQCMFQFSHILVEEMSVFADGRDVFYWGDAVEGRANMYIFDCSDFVSKEDLGTYYLELYTYVYLFPEEPEVVLPLRDGGEGEGEGETPVELPAGYLTGEFVIYNPAERLVFGDYSAEGVAEEFNEAAEEAGKTFGFEFNEAKNCYELSVGLAYSTDESQSNLQSAVAFMAQYLPDYMNLSTSMYGDPTQPDYVNLFGDNSIYFYAQFKSPDKLVSVTFISYIYNGVLGCQATIK